MGLKKKAGVLLVNLGTPDAATPKAVKAFLSEFLHDHRVVDMTRWLWCPLLHGIILPIRVPKVAKLYQMVWMEEGSPLMVHSQRQAKQLANHLVEVPVELGMTYGSPSLKTGIDKLMEQGVEHIVVLPLYPQYSATTTAAVFDGIAKQLKTSPLLPEISFITDYHSHPLYIKALAGKVRRYWQEHGQGEYLLCSYHGIPKRFADNGDVYPKHCEITTQLLAKELQLSSKQIGMSYQSRFGREEWLTPYTDKTLEAMPSNGTKKVDIMTPAFSVDCLETLEEIAEQCKESFLDAGGDEFRYIECLNDDKQHIEMMAELIKGKL
ncbi:ferrochelatase [Vibrio sp. ZSDZ34]|uniref:Ferrochelatase n=1 Tax=Vibrio gelatinilyticus TaxID=2893468 RepID=A0A9X1WBA8_9VIBR|nr:ferrochelatase [Vibrio gelatinilyticus]MCJ2377777.1 ferrochelatase [Vibrio gelatinilyticus]